MDEATSALDEDTERRMLENIRTEGGVKTCIMITHRSATAAMCSRRYELDGTALRLFEREGTT